MIFRKVLFPKSGETSPRLPPVQYLSAFWFQLILETLGNLFEYYGAEHSLYVQTDRYTV